MSKELCWSLIARHGFTLVLSEKSTVDGRSCSSMASRALLSEEKAPMKMLIRPMLRTGMVQVSITYSIGIHYSSSISVGGAATLERLLLAVAGLPRLEMRRYKAYIINQLL